MPSLIARMAQSLCAQLALTTSRLSTDCVPAVVSAIFAASSFSSADRTLPDSVTTPSLESTSIESPSVLSLTNYWLLILAVSVAFRTACLKLWFST
jgi:hypothetical protein